MLRSCCWLAVALSMPAGCARGQDARQSLATLYSFSGGTDGANPHARVTIGSGGVLYGTTYNGGEPNNFGAAFALTPPASRGGQWTETPIYTFQGGADGAHPNSDLALGTAGVLYGTTETGGTSQFGSVYALRPPPFPGAHWTEVVIHSFGATGFGAGSKGGLAIGAEGILYGTTQHGGASDRGTVFALSPPPPGGADWSYTVLYSFRTGGDGNYPLAGVVIAKGGVLYGTTYAGGASNTGTVFSLTPPAIAGEAWTETVLYSFPGESRGANPYTGVAIGSGGELYGTTQFGGSSNGGTIFSLMPSSGSSWTETVIHEFPSKGGRYVYPGRLMVTPGGAIFGSTEWGGSAIFGTIFALLPPLSPGEPMIYISLDVLSGSDGSGVEGVVIDSVGTLYGTTNSGGAAGLGTVFSMSL